MAFSTYRLRAQWLSGRVLDSRPRGRGLEPHRRHCVVALKQDTFILALVTPKFSGPTFFDENAGIKHSL